MTRLENLLMYASMHNKYYKKMVDAKQITNTLDISEYPILTREILQNNKDVLISDEYVAKRFLNHLYRLTSSGTTGVPIVAYWDPDQYASSMITLWRRRRSYYRIAPNDRYVDFTLKYRKEYKTGLNYVTNGNITSINRISMIGDEELFEFVQLLHSFSPRWIQIPPSVLVMIYHYCKSTNTHLPSSIQYIEFISEILTNEVRQMAFELFPYAKVANMYGSEEMNAIAYECPFGHMHVMSDNVYAECLNGSEILDSGQGHIILTNLHNRCMPLIRYAQNDYVEMSSVRACECGYTDKMITKLVGRNSNLTFINGISISSADVADIIALVNNLYGNPVKKYKFEYHRATNNVDCYIIFNEHFNEWKDEVFKAINSVFSEKYGDICLKFIEKDIDKNKYKHDLFSVNE